MRATLSRLRFLSCLVRTRRW